MVINYLYLYMVTILYKFIYGCILRKKNIILYVKPVNLLNLLSCLKVDSLLSFKSLLDIAVVDLPNNLLKGSRFILNYVFLNYKFESRIIIRILSNGLIPLYSISNLYKSSD